jgi:hypothetical protein
MKKTQKSVKWLILLAYVLVLPSIVFSQITVTTGISPNNLVQNVLVGNGVTISNVTFQGSLSAIGRFQTGSTPTNLGFSSGIVLGTGAVNNTIGSASSNFFSSNLGYEGYDLLTSIAGDTTFDAAILQFNFVPQNDTIKIRFVFASEEYNEFVNSTFNDAVGFFISGLNPLGASYNNKNIALIPGTNTPIIINNVNNGYSGSHCANGPCMNCELFVDNCNDSSIIYDGFTTVLTAWTVVVPHQTYTIIIAIADGGDGSYDSAVFLEANSFSSNAKLPYLTTAEITEIESFSAISGGNIIDDFGNGITQRGIVYSTFPNPSIDNNEGITVNGSGLGSFVSNMTGLTHNTKYYVRAYASNSNGTAYGNEEIFTTAIESSINNNFFSNFFISEPFPNPFTDETTIKYTLISKSQIIFNIYNTLGQQVYSDNIIDQSRGSHFIVINRNKLTSGVYYYQFTAEGSGEILTKNGKILVQ